MDITLLPPSVILTNHSHLTLLPSALPRNPHSRREFHHPSSLKLLQRCSHRYQKASRAPTNGSSPFSALPDEILLHIYTLVDFEDLLALRSSSKHLCNLALTPTLHRSMTLTTLPTSPLPTLLAQLLLPLRHLHLHLFPYPLRPFTSQSHPSTLLRYLLQQIPPDQLLSLSLPFSAPYLSSDDLCSALQHVGQRLQRLDLRGSALAGTRSSETLAEMSRLKHLDLGFTNISSLPSFDGLETLSLASCPSLHVRTLKHFLAHLPVSLKRLDISRLDQIPFEALWHVRVTHDVDGVQESTALKEVKVVGIDHLTRRDVRCLKRHWEEQRRACLPILQSHEVETGSKSKPMAIPTRWTDPNTRRGYALSPPHTPDSMSSSPSSSESGGSSLSPFIYTPATSISSGASLHSLSNRHVFLSSLSHDVSMPTSRSISPGSKQEENTEEDISVNIIHSAILESEDEDGYRRFIGEVAGATVGVGVDMEWEQDVYEYIEVEE